MARNAANFYSVYMPQTWEAAPHLLNIVTRQFFLSFGYNEKAVLWFQV
jgi:hypothetical protein